MFTSIGLSIKQLFTAITVLFMAFEKGAQAVNHIAGWTEETAAAFSDEARIMRLANRAKLLKDNNVTQKSMDSNTIDEVPSKKAIATNTPVAA